MRAQDAVRRQLRATAVRVPELFAPGARLVVGFSGGQDSTCLVHAVRSSRMRLDVIAVHVDHALRPASSDDARRVADLAGAMGVRVDVRRVDVAAYRRSLPRSSVQQAARAARYQALGEAAQEHGAQAVLVAHTADDAAETFLLNLVRGAGLAGLAGMRRDEVLDPRRLGPLAPGITPGGQAFRLVRPLLGVARSITLAYCGENGLSIVEDASNQSRAYTRNRVRLDLLPALERFNPAIRAVLARTADLVAEDLAALDLQVAGLYGSLARAQGQAIDYDLGLWRAQSRALQRRLLRRGLESLLGGLVDVGAAPIDDALNLVQSGTPAQAYHLPYGVELTIDTHNFRIRLHGRALPRGAPKSGGAELPRV